jgi:hypothetical protein
MYCPTCGSGQTFNMINEFGEGPFPANISTIGQTARAIYRCSSCMGFYRYFLLRFDKDEKGTFVAKAGQDPPMEITPEPTLEKALGKSAGLYKKGMECESQGYGIGAFSYYRRVVEEITDDLLNSISDLIVGEERAKYLEALEQVKKEHIATNKIKLVKDLLPATLRPQNANPLAILYEALSVGIHEESDELCIELAMHIREVLEYLISQVTAYKEAGKKLTPAMQKILEKKAK